MTWTTRHWHTSGGDSPLRRSEHLSLFNYSGFRIFGPTSTFKMESSMPFGCKESLSDFLKSTIDAAMTIDFQGKVSIEFSCYQDSFRDILEKEYPIKIKVKSTNNSDLLLFRLCCT